MICACGHDETFHRSRGRQCDYPSCRCVGLHPIDERNLAACRADVVEKLGHEREDLTESEFLAAYRAREYPRPSVSVDLVILTVLDADLKVLLVRRRGHPFRGAWALPGGFLRVGDTFEDQGEDLEAAAHRELEEETGLPSGSCRLEQIGAFGKAGRDPRTRVITVAYCALVRSSLAPLVKAGSDAADARWHSLVQMPALAFDHADILDAAVRHIRERIDHSALAFDLVAETFTVPDLQAVYEAVLGIRSDRANFQRRFRRLLADGFVEESPGRRLNPRGKPARVFRFRR